MSVDFGGGDEIRFERAGKAGLVTLTRPQALNAVTHKMVLALTGALAAWQSDASIELVVLKGEGRAFSAGGDLMDIYANRHAPETSLAFFADEYRLNAAIARFSKPYVALIDGIVMGGGVGISFHGSHRVMTEKAVFAMPETGIGFFPDVGASHLLPELGESFGMYLGLTGNRIRYGDALWSGLATHAMSSEYMSGLIERLCETGDADLALREVFVAARRETDASALQSIARHFSQPSLPAVIASIEQAAASDAFSAGLLATLKTRSPTSLHVAFRQISSGLTRSMDDCMRMEFRILNRMLAGHDFHEGIRALLVDKGSVPSWRPARLGDVQDADIESYFAPLDGGELAL